jgi:hypothetical protein
VRGCGVVAFAAWRADVNGGLVRGWFGVGLGPSAGGGTKVPRCGTFVGRRALVRSGTTKVPLRGTFVGRRALVRSRTTKVPLCGTFVGRAPAGTGRLDPLTSRR